MNVSQEETLIWESQARRGLKERKHLTENQLVEDIKPFKRYSRAQEGESEDKQNRHLEEGSTFKLKRQYPTYDAAINKGQSSPRQTKYKYDTTGNGARDTLSVNYLSHSIPENSSEIDHNVQARQSSIRKNMQKPQVYLGLVNNSHRMEVESIIFDSKVRKTQKMDNYEDKLVKYFPVAEELASDKNLSSFQEKANKVNEDIEAGLTHLQKMIEQLKRKKGEQNQYRLKAEERVMNLQRQFAQRRAQTKQRQVLQESQRYKFKDMIGEAEAQNLLSNLLEKEKHIPESISPMRQLEDSVADSQIQLQGDFKFKANNFPPQYTTLINRLSRQIQKDMEFTCKINDLTKAGIIEPVTKLILLEVSKHKDLQIGIDRSFFRIEASEMDPLEQGRTDWYKKYRETELEEEGIKLYKLYKDIQTHFNMKLQRSFSSQIIGLLFEELTRFNSTKDNFKDSSAVTVGHLLSYLNMRTNKSFRNRSFVKMLKRLELKPNSFLNEDALRRLVN